MKYIPLIGLLAGVLLSFYSCKKSPEELVIVAQSGNRFIGHGETVTFNANIPVSWSVNDPKAGEFIGENQFVAGDTSGIFEVEAVNLEDDTDRQTLEIWISNRADIFNELYHTGGYVLYFRHAIASVGADSFDIKPGWHLSCSEDTARQLSPEGITQAQNLGKALKYTQIPLSSTVYSSEFCRCLQTLAWMDIGTDIVIDSSITFYVYGENNRHQYTKAFIDQFQPGDKNIIVCSHSFAPGADYPWIEQGYSAVFIPGSGPTYVTTIRDDEWIVFAKD